jgi:hypothetical protein
MLGFSQLGSLALGQLPIDVTSAALLRLELSLELRRRPDWRRTIPAGAFAPVLNPETQIIRFFESRWHQPWSEPKRFKRILNPGLNLFNSMPFPLLPNPSNRIQGYYNWLNEPVWPKKGFKSHLQQTLAHPPLKINKPSVFLSMAATETNSDVMLFGIDIDPSPQTYVLIAGANVTINEIQSTNSGAVSLNED